MCFFKHAFNYRINHKYHIEIKKILSLSPSPFCLLLLVHVRNRKSNAFSLFQTNWYSNSSQHQFIRCRLLPEDSHGTWLPIPGLNLDGTPQFSHIALVRAQYSYAALTFYLFWTAQSHTFSTHLHSWKSLRCWLQRKQKWRKLRDSNQVSGYSVSEGKEFRKYKTIQEKFFNSILKAKWRMWN